MPDSTKTTRAPSERTCRQANERRFSGLDASDDNTVAAVIKEVTASVNELPMMR